MLLFWVINFINLSLDCGFRQVVFRIVKRKKNGATTLYDISLGSLKKLPIT